MREKNPETKLKKIRFAGMALENGSIKGTLPKQNPRHHTSSRLSSDQGGLLRFIRKKKKKK